VDGIFGNISRDGAALKLFVKNKNAALKKPQKIVN
jgi:hypothetical protein